MRDLLYYEDATVVSDPDRIAEQHIRGSGGITSYRVIYPDGRYGQAPVGRFALSTSYHHEFAFWVKGNKNGLEDLIQLEGRFPPVRRGHQLRLYIAQRGNGRGVLVGFDNCTTLQHIRILSGPEVLDMLGLPVQEVWREQPGFVLSAAARRERGRTTGIASVIGVGGAAVALLGAILFLFSAGDREAGGLFVVGLLLGLAGSVTLVVAVVLWVMANSRNRPRRRLRQHSYGDDFNEMYSARRRTWRERDWPPQPPALPQ